MILQHCRNTNTLTEHQAAWRHYVTVVSDAIISLISRQKWTLLQIDMAAAFDRVDSSILFRRLDEVGFRGNLLRFMKDYLSGRTFQVFVNLLSLLAALSQLDIVKKDYLGPLLGLNFVHTTTVRNDYSTRSYFFVDDPNI